MHFLRQKFYRPNLQQITLLLSSLEEVPLTAVELNMWTDAISDLIVSTCLQRMSSKDIGLLIAGLIAYNKNGLTPNLTQLALVRMFERTNGVAQELIYRSTSIANTSNVDNCDSFIGHLTAEQENTVLQELRVNGYSVLPIKLSNEKCHLLIELARKFSYCHRDDRSMILNAEALDKGAINGSIACLDHQISGSPAFNSLANDSLLINLASQYLGQKVEAQNSALWWTYPDKHASSEAAQLFHYDLDSLRWLKLFVYLNDVTEFNGPHEYVAGTHKPGSKPSHLLLRNYSRLEDKHIDSEPSLQRKKILGPAGTLILADTRCFHKGANPIHGVRILYTAVYAPNRFVFDLA